MRLSSEVFLFTDPPNNWATRKKGTFSIRSAGLHDLLHSCINITSCDTKDQVESVTCEAQEERRKNGITIGNSPRLSQIRYNAKGHLQNMHVINVVSDPGLSCCTHKHSQQFGFFIPHHRPCLPQTGLSLTVPCFGLCISSCTTSYPYTCISSPFQ